MTLALITVGDNPTPIWGISARERVARIARANGWQLVDRLPSDQPVLLVDLAFAFDPLWLRHLALQPGTAVTLGGRAALAHVADARAAQAVAAAMAARAPLPALGLEQIAVEHGTGIYNQQLRKRERPFLLPLDPAHVRDIERASYEGAYKGVTDLLTKYLWRGLAFHLTRFAAKLGMTPNMVTAIGTALCIAALVLFWQGQYWAGIAAGFAFMVLDTVDGKLARCTITSSKLGNMLDHGVDLVHPPFWWWAWLHGLAAYGTPLPDRWHAPLLVVLFAGYVLGRLIEGTFIRAFGIDMHTWRPVDSQFRLVTARRNPNMVILVGSLLVGRPDIGIVGVGAWTLISLLFHATRLAQASAERAAGRPIRSWLA